jgi:ribosomal protein S18 acetylase RimI-like enzyme
MVALYKERAQEQGEFRGLRRLQSGRDLRAVADLIEEAFAREMDSTGRAALRELRLTSYWGAVLPFSSIEGALPFSGFVWVEDGDIVGNVTLQRSNAFPKRWFISNVAVKRRYRGRGIGRELVAAAIDEARLHGGQEVTLQVRASNAPAIHLYHSLGFEDRTATTYLKLERVGPVEPATLPGVLLRPRCADDGRRIYELVRAATPPGERRESPVREQDYRLGFGQRLAETLDKLLGGPVYHRLVAEAQGRLAGIIVVKRARWHGHHRLRMKVHPDYHGQLEKPLVSHGLALLQQAPDRPTFVKHSADHRAGVAAFKSYGFQETHTLTLMALGLSSR